MKNKLWVYGCSFSEPFGLTTGTDITITEPYGGRLFNSIDYWGTILARCLDLECITRSLSGVGWNYITEQIDQDLIHWSPDDVIIISPSFFSRVTFEELTQRDSQSELAMRMRPWDQITEYNSSRWRRRIDTLHHLSYNRVYTWLVDDYAAADSVKNLITAPDGSVNWRHWMDKNKQYWRDPDFNPPWGDWHFNALGHQAVARRFHEVICAPQQ